MKIDAAYLVTASRVVMRYCVRMCDTTLDMIYIYTMLSPLMELDASTSKFSPSFGSTVCSLVRGTMNELVMV